MVLYHASPVKNLKIIKPQRTLSHDKYIGDYVFATKDIKLAAMYLATKGLYTMMEPEDKPPYIVIVDNAKNYLKNDKGGAIYILPSKDFSKTPQKGLEEYELVNKESVKPFAVQKFEKSLDAMKEMGIKIYFVDQDTFDSMGRDKIDKIIPTLTPYS